MMNKSDLLPVLNQIKYIDQIKENYDIRFCREDEIDDVVNFIRKYWKEDHIFVLSRELLDWQHHDVKNHRYSIIITKDKKTGEIGSILGVVKSSQYDPNIQYNLVWPSLWCSRNDISVKGLGIALYYYLKEVMEPETVVGIGANPETLRYYESWGFRIGIMQQYYMINDDILQYRLVEIQDEDAATPVKTGADGGKKIVSITQEDFCALGEREFKQYSRYKSKQYYVNRYVKHPIYHYLFFRITDGKKICAIVVGRECWAKGACALRIVDYAGDYTAMEGMACEWMGLLKANGYEYVDFICRGIMEKSIRMAGFKNLKEHDVIIPNYYEPFCKQNVELLYFYKSLQEGRDEELVKGDADQDRPGILPPGKK